MDQTCAHLPKFISFHPKFSHQTCICITFNSCNTGTSVLPDMYTRIPRAAGPRDEGVHIRQNTSARVTTIM